MSAATAPGGLHSLDERDRKTLRRIVDKHGLAGTSHLLDVSRGVVASAVAGIGVRRGSVELLREAIQKHRSNGNGHNGGTHERK